jgi:hypothetical protein
MVKADGRREGEGARGGSCMVKVSSVDTVAAGVGGIWKTAGARMGIA